MILLLNKYKQVISFLTVGLLTAVIYFSLFTMTWKWLQIDYKVAVSISYISAAIFQFISNRNVTFKSREENIIYQLSKFIVLLIINYILTLIIVIGLVNKLSVYPYFAILISIGVTVISGFLLSKLWVFKTFVQHTSHS